MVADTREEIRIGQLAIRFLVEGQASGGSIAVFEFDVPAGAKVPAAHSHNGYEETIYGLEGRLTLTVTDARAMSARARCFAYRAEQSTTSTTATQSMQRCSRLSALASSDRTTSAKSLPSLMLQPVARPTTQRWPK